MSQFEADVRPRAVLDAPAWVSATSARGLAYGDRGSGPPVVLVHGWCLNRELWMYLDERLAGEHRVVAPDLAGFGGSRALSGPYDLDRQADELGALLDELDLDGAVVVGFALGAAVAMALAARRHPRISGLVLIGVPSAAHAPYERMPRAMRRDWPEFARRSAVAICKQPQSQATLEWLSAMFRATPLPVALETVELLGRFEPEPLAARIPVDALFVHGEHDDVVPASVSAACAERMERGSVAMVADSGHLVVLDQKERLAELVEEFARSHARGLTNQ